VGWIAYWSLGNSALALKIIVGLIRKLDMTDSVFEALTPIAMTREADTNAKIVMLMKAALAETKQDYRGTRFYNQDSTLVIKR